MSTRTIAPPARRPSTTWWRTPRVLRALPVVVSLAAAAACADPAKERLKASVQPTYDGATGRLRELAFDANGNGRVETWTEMDGTRPVRSRVDTNEDGRIDRWEEYDEHGALVRVGFSRAGTGVPDAWAFPAADGTLHRIEISSVGDERRIDRWEHYAASSSDPEGRGALVRAEEDTNRDGRPDRWETYEHGALRTIALDENGDGQPDRRLTYVDNGQVILESLGDRGTRIAGRRDRK